MFFTLTNCVVQCYWRGSKQRFLVSFNDRLSPIEVTASCLVLCIIAYLPGINNAVRRSLGVSGVPDDSTSCQISNEPAYWQVLHCFIEILYACTYTHARTRIQICSNTTIYVTRCHSQFVSSVRPEQLSVAMCPPMLLYVRDRRGTSPHRLNKTREMFPLSKKYEHVLTDTFAAPRAGNWSLSS